jgi:hypothetical protein
MIRDGQSRWIARIAREAAARLHFRDGSRRGTHERRAEARFVRRPSRYNAKTARGGPLV